MTPASRAFTRTLRLVLQSLPHCATLTIVCIRATQCAAAPPPKDSHALPSWQRPWISNLAHNTPTCACSLAKKTENYFSACILKLLKCMHTLPYTRKHTIGHARQCQRQHRRVTRWVQPAVRVVLPAAEPDHVAHLETRVHLPVAKPACGAHLETHVAYLQTHVAYLASGGVRLLARFVR